MTVNIYADEMILINFMANILIIEMTKRLLRERVSLLKESIAGFKAFPNRLLKAFPNLDNNVFEMMKKWREEAKEKRKKEKEHKKDS